MDIAFADHLPEAWCVAIEVTLKGARGLPSNLRVLTSDLADALTLSRFKCEPGEVLDLVGRSDFPTRRLLIGASTGGARDVAEALGAHAAKAAIARKIKCLAVFAGDHDPCDVAGGALLAAYRFDQYRAHTLKTKPAKDSSLERIIVICPEPLAARSAWDTRRGGVEGALLVRDLINEPPNVLTPSAFVDRLDALRDLGVEVVALGEADLEAQGMNALLGVGRGSANETRLGVMTWRGGGEAPFTALVGKGVTFDTGGISLKPADKMEEMKCDMGGAAAVTGAMHAIARRKARANVVGVIALVENMPDGKAQRPSDIVTSMSGQTIEIINTDGEGRLALADALTWVQREWKPVRIIDLATLTGAMMVGLGHVHAGLFANNDELARDLTTAGAETGETVWRMPLGAAYDKLMDSTFADMKNSAGQIAGAITAAQFLSRFVEPEVAWAHLDIAGVATRPLSDDPRYPVWATGWGPRLLDRFVALACEGGQ